MKWMNVVLGFALLVSIGLTTGCSKSSTGSGSGISPNTAKLLVQTAALTFESALTEQGVSWDTAKFNTDLNNTIAAFTVGATWKQQVLNLLPSLSADVSAIACKNSKCTNLVTIFVSGIQSVIADLNSTTTAKLNAKYHSYDAYVKDWNAVAPQDAQLDAQGF